MDFTKRISIIFYDTETTSRGIYDEHIIQLGAAQAFWVPEGHIQSIHSEFCQFVCTDRRIHPDAVKVHGISEKKLIGAQRFRQVMMRFLRWMRESSESAPVILVGHNSDTFDFSIVCQEMYRHSLSVEELWLDAGVVGMFDLMKWFKREKITRVCDADHTLLPLTKSGNVSYALGGIYEAFFHEPFMAHDARADACAVHRILTAICNSGDKYHNPFVNCTNISDACVNFTKRQEGRIPSRRNPNDTIIRRIFQENQDGVTSVNTRKRKFSELEDEAEKKEEAKNTCIRDKANTIRILPSTNPKHCLNCHILYSPFFTHMCVHHETDSNPSKHSLL